MAQRRAQRRQEQRQPPSDRRKQASDLPAFEQDSKSYNDPLFLLSHRSSALFTALREWAAIAIYRWRGEA